jgi:hypothetical protein
MGVVVIEGERLVTARLVSPLYHFRRGSFYLSYNRVAMAKKKMSMASAMKKVEGSKADMSMDKKLAMKMMKAKGKKK